MRVTRILPRSRKSVLFTACAILSLIAVTTFVFRVPSVSIPSPEELVKQTSFVGPRTQGAFESKFDLKIYVYDMPAKFNYDLLGCIKSYFGRGTVWSADLISTQDSAGIFMHQWLLNSNYTTANPEEADLFFVPYYKGTEHMYCYTGMPSRLEEEFIVWLKSQPYYQRHGGRDHVYAYSNIWMARLHQPYQKQIGSGIGLGWNIYLEEMDEWKDIVVPYFAHPGLTAARHTPLPEKDIVAFMAASLERGPCRVPIAKVFDNASDCVVGEFSAMVHNKPIDNGDWYVTTIRKSKFCLAPCGDTPDSRRLYDAIIAGCIPVLFEDPRGGPYTWVLPFQSQLNYDEFSYFFPFSITEKGNALLEFLRNVPEDEYQRKLATLLQVRELFVYGVGDPNAPDADNGLVMDMIMQQLSWRGMIARGAHQTLHWRQPRMPKLAQ